MALHYTLQEERRLQEGVRRGETPSCPRCDGVLHLTSVSPTSRVAYVRRRVILQCSACGRKAVVESRSEPR